MSKSQWNAVAPGEITKKYGADILRIWAASVDYQADCSMSDEILKQCSEAYRKVRNTFRFLLANISDFTKADLVAAKELPLSDQYMLCVLNDVNEKVKQAYREYRYSDASGLLTNVMTNEFSAYYLDYTKDILYIEKQNAPRRHQVQSVLYHAVDVLLRLWAPILVHTCEEINSFFHAEEKSIHLGRFAENVPIANSDDIVSKMKRLLAMRSDIFKALEEARSEKIIGKSLEAHVHLQVSEADRALIEEVFGDRFAQWLIVSEVSFSGDQLKTYETCEAAVTKAEGVVCPRCWNITHSHAEDGLCERCANVLK